MNDVVATMESVIDPHAYGEFGRVFVGTFLRSLGGIYIQHKKEWAKKVYNDFKGFDIYLERGFAMLDRSFLPEELNETNWEIPIDAFPKPEEYTHPESYSISIILRLDKQLKISYGIDRESKTLEPKTYIVVTPMEDLPDGHYCKVKDISEVLNCTDDSVINSFEEWMPFMAHKFLILMIDEKKRSELHTMNMATLSSMSMMFSSSYQSTIQKYLAEHVYSESRGIDRENIVDHGVPLQMLELVKFEAINLDIKIKTGKKWVEDGKLIADNLEIYDVSLIAVGRNTEGTPKYLFTFTFAYHSNIDKTGHVVIGPGFDVHAIDMINHKLEDIPIKGTLIPEILTVFFNTQKEVICIGLDMIAGYHKNMDSFDGTIHIEGDDNHAKIAKYPS